MDKFMLSLLSKLFYDAYDLIQSFLVNHTIDRSQMKDMKILISIVKDGFKKYYLDIF